MNGKEIRAILARNLKSFRNHREWSQADLAFEAGISIPFLSDIERENKWPYPETLSKLAVALNVEVHELFLKENTSDNEARNFTVRVIKEIMVAQKKGVASVCKQYLGKNSLPF
jgi:transcriptional regulator with XRE-family HTH domain